MRPLSPSAIRAVNALCPASLDYYWERNEPLTDLFDVGTAAHKILESIAILTAQVGRVLSPDEIANAAEVTCAALIGGNHGGRPIAPDQVFNARDLAVAFAVANPIGPEAKAEAAAAFDARWQPVAFDDPTAIFRLVLDLYEGQLVIDEDGDEYNAVIVTDYKTSWQADAAELDSLQMRSQAMAIHLAINPDRVVQRIANLRTGKIHSREYSREALADLSIQTQREVELTYAALSGERKHRIGAHCVACPHVLRCPAARAAFDAAGVDAQPYSIAESYVAARGIVKRLEPILQAYCEEFGDVTMPGGAVGYFPSVSNSASLDGAKIAIAEWRQRGGDMEGLIACIDGFNATQAKEIARRMFPARQDKSAREEFLGRVLTSETKPRWQVRISKAEAEVAE
jgi:hypothetical protein